MVIGHNERIAWGVCVPAGHSGSLPGRFHPDDPTLYQVGDGWERATVHHESVHVRGEATPGCGSHQTRHGPLVTSLLPWPNEPDRVALSLHWVGHEPLPLGP